MIPPISIDFASLNFITISPMIVAIIGALSILCIDLVNKNLDKSFYIILTVLFLFIDLLFVYGFNSEARGMFDLMFVDGIAILSQLFILVSSILFILLSFTKQRFNEYRYAEYFALYLFMVTGFQFMVSSDSLILIFVGLETSSIALYTIIAMHNRSNAIEAAIKYFTLGAISTAFFAFSCLLFYASTGTLELGQISEVIYSSSYENYSLILLGVVFMVAALGFKLSLVPFHLWVADVYEGSTPALAGFISIVPKIAGFVVALRFFEIFVASENIFVEAILFGMVVLTMTIPNLIALGQNDIKRMLAYSSISNAGFVMAAILIGTTQATTAMFLYWILFLFTNLGAFTILWLSTNKQYEKECSSHSLQRYQGLIKSSPLVAILFGLFLLSLAGIPPFALFWGKLYLLGSAINAGYTILAIIMALNAAIAAYYYLRPIVYMFLKESQEEEKMEFLKNATTMTKVVVGFCAFCVITAIFFIQTLLENISYYIQISGF